MAHVVIDLFQYILSVLIIYRLEIMRNILFYIQLFFFLNIQSHSICHHTDVSSF